MSIISFKEWYNLAEAAIDERYPYKAVFTAGGPGSGKSWVAKHMFDHHGFKFSNSDQITSMLAKKCGESDVMQSLAGQPGYDRKKVHSTAAAGLTVKQTACWMNNGLPYVIDITGRDVSLVQVIDKKLKDEGYDTYMVFVRTDLDAALRRTVTRATDGGHAVDADFQQQAWQDAMQNLEAYQKMFGSQLAIIDNSTDLHDKRDQSIMGTRLIRKAAQLLGQPKVVRNPIGQAKLKDVAGWYSRQRQGAGVGSATHARPSLLGGGAGLLKMGPGTAVPGTLPGDSVSGMGHNDI